MKRTTIVVAVVGLALGASLQAQSWTDLGPAPDSATALAACDNGLFAAGGDDDLWYVPLAKPAGWTRIGPAAGATAADAARRWPMKRFALFVVAALVPLSSFAGVLEVKLKLPLKPKLQISGDEKVAIAPFVIANNGEKKSDRAQKIDVQAEFQRYLRKQLTKSTKLRLVDVPAGYGAHPTQVLGEDEVGLDAPDQLGIEGVERSAVGDSIGDGPVDVAGSGAVEDEPAGRDDRLGAGVWRMVTAVGDRLEL